MSKIVSPMLFRFKNIPNYLNKIHIKISKNYNYLSYLNFFQILLNFIYLLKSKIEKYNNFKEKLLYLNCSYYDFYNISISLIFHSLRKKDKKYFFLYKKIIKLFNYINYFLKFNLYKNNYFIFLHIKLLKNYNENIYYIIISIKNILKRNKKFKLNIIYFINCLFKKHKYNNKINIQGVKCVYSGCLYKNSKKKSFKYLKGNTSTTSTISNILYSKKHVKTSNGIVGIKIWLYK